MPPDEPALYQQERTIENVAEERESEYARVHFGYLERALGQQHEIAQAVVGDDHFREDSQNERDREADPRAGQDWRAGRRDNQLAKRLQRPRAERPRRVKLDAIDRAHAA